MQVFIKNLLPSAFTKTNDNYNNLLAFNAFSALISIVHHQFLRLLKPFRFFVNTVFFLQRDSILQLTVYWNKSRESFFIFSIFISFVKQAFISQGNLHRGIVCNAFGLKHKFTFVFYNFCFLYNSLNMTSELRLLTLWSNFIEEDKRKKLSDVTKLNCRRFSKSDKVLDDPVIVF